MFRRQQPRPSPVGARPAPPVAEPAPDSLENPSAPQATPSLAEFNRLLTQTLGGNPSVSAGHVQLIGLERLRDYLGDDWSSEKAKVHATADSVIRSYLLKGDIHKQIDDISFIVVFASLGRDAARLKCAMIADAIVKRLIGSSDDLSFINIRTALLKEDGKVVLQRVTDLESLVRQMIGQAPDDLDASSETWSAADPGNRRRHLEWHLKTVEYQFQPLWCVPRGIIFLYRVLATRTTASGETRCSYRLLPQPDDPDAILELDLRCARRALLELTRGQDDRRHHLIGLRIHFETAASVKRRLQLVNVLQSLPEHLRQYLVCTIVRVPDGISQTKLTDIVGGLRTFFRLITTTLRSPNTDLRPFADANIYAVGMALPPAQGLAHVAGLEMRRFCKEAESLNLRTYLHNLSNPILVRHALALGFEYIDGDAIAGAIPRPAGMVPLSARDLTV